MVEEAGHSEDFVASGTIRGAHLEAGPDHVLEVLRVHGAYWVVFTRDNLRIKAFHSRCAEGWLLHSHLVDHAAQRPNITTEIVWHVFPHLRAGIVGRTSLGPEQAPLRHFRDVKVAKFNDSFLR